MNNLVYIAINERSSIHECILSIKSYFQVVSETERLSTRLIVYTDQPEAFNMLQDSEMIIEYVEEEQLNAWIGKNKYIYKIKICALLHALIKYNSPTLLVDADTMFLKKPEKLFTIIQKPDTVILNYIENDLQYICSGNKSYANPGRLALYSHMAQNKQIDTGKHVYHIQDDMAQWNSGVIGLHPSDSDLLHRAIDLCDYIYDKYNIRVSEQIALSCVFQSEKKVFSTDDVLYHYWPFHECRYILENYYYGESQYQYPKKYFNQYIIDLIKSVKTWDIPYEILFAMIVVLTQKKYEIEKFPIQGDFLYDSIMKSIVCDRMYLNKKMSAVEDYCYNTKQKTADIIPMLEDY